MSLWRDLGILFWVAAESWKINRVLSLSLLEQTNILTVTIRSCKMDL